MPQPLAPQSLILLTLRYRQVNQVMLTTLMTRWSGVVQAPDYTTVLDDLGTIQVLPANLAGRTEALIVASATLESLTLQPVNPIRLAPRVFPVNRPGQQDGEPLPTNVALTCMKTSDFATRYGRGSVHLPAMANDNLVDAGRWQGAFLNDVQNWCNFILAGMGGSLPGTALLFPVLWNPRVPARVTGVTGMRPMTTPRTMYRRTVGVGI